MSATCVRPECARPLPAKAIAELDLYCSTRCCRIAHGLEEDLGERDYRHARQRCKSCGTVTAEDVFTPGCKPCRTRQLIRRKAGTIAA